MCNIDVSYNKTSLTESVEEGRSYNYYFPIIWEKEAGVIINYSIVDNNHKSIYNWISFDESIDTISVTAPSVTNDTQYILYLLTETNNRYSASLMPIGSTGTKWPSMWLIEMLIIASTVKQATLVFESNATMIMKYILIKLSESK